MKKGTARKSSVASAHLTEHSPSPVMESGRDSDAARFRRGYLEILQSKVFARPTTSYERRDLERWQKALSNDVAIGLLRAIWKNSKFAEDKSEKGHHSDSRIKVPSITTKSLARWLSSSNLGPMRLSHTLRFLSAAEAFGLLKRTKAQGIKSAFEATTLLNELVDTWNKKILGVIVQEQIRKEIRSIYGHEEIEKIVQDAKLNMLPGSRGQENRNSTGEQTEGNLLRSRHRTFPVLSTSEVNAVLEHGKTHTWNTRTKRGFGYHTDVFEYVRDTYSDWIPGLTQELLFESDSSIESYYKKRKSEVGLPSWLFIPAGAEARDLLEADPRRSAWREIERDRSRTRRARVVKAQPH